VGFGPYPADFGNELKPVDMRHQEIETDQIEVLGFHQAQDFARVGYGDRPMAQPLQPLADYRKNVTFVID